MAGLAIHHRGSTLGNRVPPAVIVGFETNGLGVARALSEAGIRSISLAGPDWSPVCASRSTSVVMASGWNEDAVVADLIAIGKRLPARAPLLITKDEPVLWISANRSVLDQYFEIRLPDPEVVHLLMDKIQFHALAAERGWPLPRTWRIKTREELDAVISEVVQPCILKPAVKNSTFRQRSPRKAFKLQSAADLLKTYDLVSAWEPDVIIQEWIEGGDDRIAFGLGYWNAESEGLAIFPGRKLRQWPPECGNTALSGPAPAEWRADVEKLTATIMGTVRHRGLGSVEYKVDFSGRLFIMEPTVGRTNYQNEVAVLNGVNLPAIAYYDGAGLKAELARELERAYAPHPPRKLIDSLADYRSARVYMTEGTLTWRAWLESRRGPKSGMTYRFGDPIPALVDMSRSLASYAKHELIKPILRPLLPRRDR